MAAEREWMPSLQPKAPWNITWKAHHHLFARVPCVPLLYSRVLCIYCFSFVMYRNPRSSLRGSAKPFWESALFLEGRPQLRANEQWRKSLRCAKMILQLMMQRKRSTFNDVCACVLAC